MRKVKSVALLIETSKAYGRGLLMSVGRYSRLHGPWAIYVQERGLGDEIPDWLATNRFDGMMVRASDPEVLEQVQQLGIPTVFLGEKVPDGRTAVLTDDRACAEIAANHFHQRGFRDFAFVGVSGFTWSDIRRDHFLQSARGLGGQTHVLEPSSASRPRSWHTIQKSIVTWLTQLPKPVGVMCCYDGIARNVLDACRQCGLLVPEQVALIGVDNDEVLCEVCDPPLTSIAPDTNRIGFAASELLQQMMHGTDTTEKIIVEPKGLVLRESSDIIALDDPEIAKALGFIRRQATSGIGVDDVVEQISVCRRTLERKFNELLGHSPLEEIARLKLEKVKALLVDTDLSVDEIADRSGFAYTGYMISQFRKREQMTPLQFRRMQNLAPSHYDSGNLLP